MMKGLPVSAALIIYPGQFVFDQNHLLADALSDVSRSRADTPKSQPHNSPKLNLIERLTFQLLETLCCLK
ncbi:hypothetical protein CSC3H3_10425 [Thalassospira marina]|uniref:Uncharacterized protein n=1 Tax=Thalassospira marina TaxID=2048283 RepID=A0ABM6Q975_9PROT|nr:hypothetical protein CSC3H3_10425 [Thalassospira marina]